MQKYEIDKYIKNPNFVDEKIKEYIEKKIIKKENENKREIKGHILKSEHNLRFVADNIKLNYIDWAIIGCYYASYHSALALIMTKGYSSKNHLATLLLLIREFYDKGLNSDDIEILGKLLDYQDILFYVESKNKREDATYLTKTNYTKKEVEQIRIKSTLFISKAKDILKLT
ncbi:MAG: HEPN domain-containing protein [Nanoarchaeota archaeon]